MIIIRRLHLGHYERKNWPDHAPGNGSELHVHVNGPKKNTQAVGKLMEIMQHCNN